MVSLLLRSGYSSNVNPTDEYGITPLAYAAAYGIIETTKVLLEAGANPFRHEEISNMSMWHYALFCQPTEFIQEVIEFCMTASSQMANYAIELCLLIRMGHRFAVQGGYFLPHPGVPTSNPFYAADTLHGAPFTASFLHRHL